MKLAVTIDFDCRPGSLRRRCVKVFGDALRVEVWPFRFTVLWNIDRILGRVGWYK